MASKVVNCILEIPQCAGNKLRGTYWGGIAFGSAQQEKHFPKAHTGNTQSQYFEAGQNVTHERTETQLTTLYASPSGSNAAR
jgi:hypothetical protein